MRDALRKAETFVRSRSTLLIACLVSLLAGLGIAAGYATAVEYTTSPAFCAHGCHEMERTVYREYAQSKHYRNSQGVVVTCAQCHVPQDGWGRKLRHEASGAAALWGHFVDREYLPGRFEAKRAALAKKVLADFAADRARECKTCHAYASMLLDGQGPEARKEHADAAKTDANCLECHQGVAHQRMEEPVNFDLP